MPKLLIPEIPGVKDFHTLVEFLKNAETYGAHLQKLEEVREELVVLVEAVSDVENAAAFSAQARNDRGMAAEELRNAKVEAERIRTQAVQDRDAAVILRDTAVAEAARVVKDAEAELIRQRSEVSVRETKASAQLAEGQRLAAAGIADQSEAAAIRADYESRLERLRSKMAEAGV